MTLTWTDDNTEGFTENELAILNGAQERLEAAFPEVDPSNISDMLNNAFTDGATIHGLFTTVCHRLLGGN